MYHTAAQGKSVRYIGLLGRPQEAETEKVAALAGCVIAANRRCAAAAVLPQLPPRRTRLEPRGARTIHYSNTCIALIPVLYPLPDIAMHV